jgi:hypothetical protein
VSWVCLLSPGPQGDATLPWGSEGRPARFSGTWLSGLLLRTEETRQGIRTTAHQDSTRPPSRHAPDPDVTHPQVRWARSRWHASCCITTNSYLNHFRWKIVQRAAQRVSSRRWRMHAPPKIRNFQFALAAHRQQIVSTAAIAYSRHRTHVVANKQVLRLDVSVNDVLGVAVRQCFSHLANVAGGPVLAESPFRSQLLVQLALRCKPAPPKKQSTSASRPDQAPLGSLPARQTRV